MNTGNRNPKLAAVDYVPLNEVQSAFWRAWRHFPDRPMHHRSMKVEWRTALQKDPFEAALNDLVARTDVLRLRFVERDGVPYQHAAAPWDIALEYRDFSAVENSAEAGVDWLTGIELRPFDLTRGVFVTALAKCAEDHWIWLFNQHHVVTDFTSSALLVERLADLYAQHKAGKIPAADPYPAFLSFEKAHGRARSVVRLDGPRPVRLLPFLPAEPTRFAQPKPMLRREVHLGPDRLARLRAHLGLVAQDTGKRFIAGLFETLLSTTLAFMSRISRESRVSLGTLSHGRFAPGSANVVGPFLLPLPLTVEIAEDWTARDLAAAVRVARRNVYRAARQGQPIEGARYGATVNFIPDTLPDLDGVRSREITKERPLEAVSRDFNVTARAADTEGDVKILFSVNKEIAERLDFDNLMQIYLRLFDAMVDSDPIPINKIPLIGDSDLARERQKAQTAAAAPPPPYNSLVEGFLQQVAKTPDAIAVRGAEDQLSYLELEQQARRIAAGLRARGIGAGDLVAFRLPRTPLVLATLLGILRAGAGYLALDTRLPEDRASFMLSDSAARLLIVPADEIADQPFDLPITSPEALLGDGADQTDDLPAVDPDQIMYIMYTSGTTSQPKGVIIPHRSFALHNDWACRFIDDDRPLDWALATTLSFESSYRAFMALTTGGTIVTYQAPDQLTGMSVVDALKADEVDGIAITPSQLRLICDQRWQLQRIRTVISLGEPLPTELAHRLRSAFGDKIALQNWYGPTETTMATTAHTFDPDMATDATVPIGKPADGAAIHILDAGGNPVPDGLIGEIHVGGVRMSNGYLNRPDLTAAAFIDDPFRPGGKLYRTGDLGRFDRLGNLVHHGRNDDQIKINGVRIELAEVEAGVAHHPEIRKCAVVTWGDTPKRLAAFYMSDRDISAIDLRQSAEKVLANVMVPSVFQRIDAMPMTATGKTDRRLLQTWVVQQDGTDDTSEANPDREPPSGKWEMGLARIWRRVLDRDDVARDDDFFAAGGDSLSFVQMVLLAERDFELAIPIEQMAGIHRLSEMAALLASLTPSESQAARPQRSLGTRVMGKTKRLLARGKTVPTPPALETSGHWPDIRRRIMLAAQSWPGTQVGRTLPVMAFNAKGALPALFWCFNGAKEPPVMARELGKAQPLYALRSMQAVVATGHKRVHNESLASDYADEIMALQPEGPIYVGGNCQSGRIADAIARQLLLRGREVGGLFLLDHVPPEPLAADVTLFFGRQSEGFNPFLTRARPELDWQDRFSSVRWDIVPGGHGYYFDPQNAPALANRLRERLSAAVQVQSTRQAPAAKPGTATV